MPSAALQTSSLPRPRAETGVRSAAADAHAPAGPFDALLGSVPKEVVPSAPHAAAGPQPGQPSGVSKPVGLDVSASATGAIAATATASPGIKVVPAAAPEEGAPAEDAVLTGDEAGTAKGETGEAGIGVVATSAVPPAIVPQAQAPALPSAAPDQPPASITTSPQEQAAPSGQADAGQQANPPAMAAPAALASAAQAEAAPAAAGVAAVQSVLPATGVRPASSNGASAAHEAAKSPPAAPAREALGGNEANMADPRKVASASDAQPGEQKPEGSKAAEIAPAPSRDAQGTLRIELPQSLPAPPTGAAAAVATISASSPAGVTAAAAAAPTLANADAGIPLTGVAVEIAARAMEGKRRFEIRLDPPELGRIDVRLDVSRDGQVTSRLVVERAETLDLLRRDAHALERALQSAGLRTDQSGLEFSLRDQSGGQRHHQELAPRPHVLIMPNEDVAVREAVRRGYGVLRGLGGGVDIRI